MKKKIDALRDYFAKRLNAGIPLTLEEWQKLSDLNKAIWEDAYAEYIFKRDAFKAHLLSDAIKGGRIAVKIVWDLLDEKTQELYLLKWQVEDAQSNTQPTSGATDKTD